MMDSLTSQVDQALLCHTSMPIGRGVGELGVLIRGSLIENYYAVAAGYFNSQPRVRNFERPPAWS